MGRIAGWCAGLHHGDVLPAGNWPGRAGGEDPHKGEDA